MTGALVLAGSGLLVLAIGRWPLLWLSRAEKDPHVAMVAWVFAVAGAFGSVAVGVLMLVLPDHIGVLGLLGKAGSCLVHLGHEGLPTAEEIAGAWGVVAVSVVGVRILVVAVKLGAARRRTREHHRFLIGLLSADRQIQDGVVWLENDALLAYSLGGRPQLVVASRGVRERLTSAALAATLEHERAHLRGHHHLLLAAADTLAAALPFSPLLRQAPLSLRVLVEYAADTAAIDRCGSPAVRAALLSFIGSPNPGHGLAMTGPTIVHRLDRLEVSRRSSKPRRTLSCGIAGVAAVLVPIAVSAAVFLGVACPSG